MNLFEEAFKKAGVSANDFEDREVDTAMIELDEQIKFLEEWCKMVKRNASEKEKHNFVVKHGFLSVNHFSLWLSITDDYESLQYELSEDEYFLPEAEKSLLSGQIEYKKNMADNIKNHHSYYSMIMRALGKQDISPYGEDILKRVRTSILDKHKVWTEDDFKKCEGYSLF